LQTTADTVIDRIQRTFDMLADAPLAGRSRDELKPNLRSFPVGNYMIFYVPLPDGVEVVRVMNGRQDIDADDMA
jgi:toxin ParE1/3/4